MIPYLIVFSLVIAIGALAQNEKLNDKLKLGLLILASIILSLFGGLRSYDVGTDIHIYGQSYYEKAFQSNDYKEYAFNESINTQHITDHGYLFTNYALSRFFETPTALLITLQLLANIPIFIWLYRRRNRISIPLAILIYLCLWYGRTLNMLRQAVALSFMVLGFDYLLSGSRKKYLILTLIAYSFHSTVLYAAILQLLLLALRKFKLASQRKIEKIVLIGTILSVFSITAIITLLYQNGIIGIRLFSYIDRFSIEEVDFLNSESVINILITIPIAISYFSKRHKDEKTDIPEFYSLFGLITFFAKSFIMFTDRFALYFQYFNLVLVPEKLREWRPDNRKNKIAVYLLFVVALVAYWYVKHVIQGAHEIIPYSSILQ